MTKFFDYPFATAGDKTTIPDLAQPDGSVSYQIGFGSDYQLIYPSDPSSKAIPRYGFNQLMYDVTGAVQQYQTYGFFEYQTGWAYDVAAVVRYNPGSGVLLYQSLVPGNTALPTDTTKWAIFGAASPPGQYARAVLGALQVITLTGFPHLVEIDTATLDPFNIVSGAPGYSIIPSIAGGYRFGVHLRVIMSGAGDLSCDLYKNGVEYSILDFSYGRSVTAANEEVTLVGSDVVYANGTTDYFQIYVTNYTTGIKLYAGFCYFNVTPS